MSTEHIIIIVLVAWYLLYTRYGSLWAYKFKKRGVRSSGELEAVTAFLKGFTAGQLCQAYVVMRYGVGADSLCDTIGSLRMHTFLKRCVPVLKMYPDLLDELIAEKGLTEGH